MNSRRWMLAAVCAVGVTTGILGFQGRAKAPPRVKKSVSKTSMNPTAENPQLTLAPTNSNSRLLPEQAARFDLVFQNLSSQEAQLASLTGNDSTPSLRLFDGAGTMVSQFDSATIRRRAGAHMHDPPSPAALVYLQAGVQDGSQINLWNYTAPLPPGRYRLQAAHQIRPGAHSIDAATEFEIVPASVSSVAMNYGVSDHGSSLLSWLSQPLDKKSPPEILIRLSAGGNHGALMHGATAAGQVATGTHLTSSGLPPFSDIGDCGWLAVSHGTKIELIRHALAQVTWRSGEFDVDLANLKPVPRFPDRGHALFLATGTRQGKPVLMGLRVEDDPARSSAPPAAGSKLVPGPSEPIGVNLSAPIQGAGPKTNPVAPLPAPKHELPAYHPWTVPLQGEPVRTAVAFHREGPITILLIYNKDGVATLSRIDVDESGQVVKPETVILAGNKQAEIWAVAVDARKDQPISFLALGGDRQNRNQLALIKIPLEGAPTVQEFPSLPGWPARTVNGRSVPLAAVEMVLEPATDGRPWLAVIDEDGRLSGGVLDGSPLKVLRAEGRCSNAYIAALPGHVTPGCFTEKGELFPAGDHGHSH